MDRKSELEIVRRAYAKRIMFAAGVADRRVETAFAAVPREDFLGRGPWQIVRWGRGYVTTPSRNPVYLYDDVVVAILPERNLNNGQPSLHAWLMASAAPKAGEHVVHIGVGLGYYTAILAHLAGRSGKVTAIEYDPELAARSARNLADLAQRKRRQRRRHQNRFCGGRRDLRQCRRDPSAAALARPAGGGRPSDPAADRSRFPDGRYPPRRGVPHRAAGRRLFGEPYFGVAIFPCAGARDDDEATALAGAFARGGAEKVTRLYRHDDVPEADCWLQGKGWCLAYR
jgi:protein-L-isoaspartate(D-aspartate) O-methyltransferase